MKFGLNASTEVKIMECEHNTGRIGFEERHLLAMNQRKYI